MQMGGIVQRVGRVIREHCVCKLNNQKTKLINIEYPGHSKATATDGLR